MRLTSKEIVILAILAAINFTHIVDFMVLMPLQPQLELIFDLSPTRWSWVVSSYSFAAFLSGLASVFFIDCIDRKAFLLWVYLGFLLATVLCGWANSFEMLLIARCLAGAFGGIISSAILAMVGDLIVFEKRGRAMGVIMLGFSLAAALGVPFGIYLGTSYSWRMPFYVLGAMSLVLLLIGLFVVPKVQVQNKQFSLSAILKGIKNIWTTSKTAMTLVFYFLLIFSQFIMIPFLTPFMVKNVGFSDLDLVVMYGLGGGATLITAPIIGKLSDRVGFIKGFQITLFLSLIPLCAVPFLPFKAFLIAFVISTLFFTIVSGRIIPAMAILVSVVPDHLRGMYMSFRAVVQQLASALSALIAGFIVIEQAGAYVYYEWLAAVAVLVSLSSLFFVRFSK